MIRSLFRLVITCELDLEIMTTIVFFFLEIRKSECIIFITIAKNQSIECKHRLIKVSGADHVTEVLQPKSNLHSTEVTSGRHISQEVVLFYDEVTIFQWSLLN